VTELGPILTRSADALERLATLRRGAMQREMDAADPVPDIEELRALATKLRGAAQLPLSRAKLALGQLTKEELGRLELAERLVASPSFQFDPSEEAARQAISADLRSIRERVPDRKRKRG
jgi:hypothetical protein